jgi:hypothetical protein
MSISISIPYNRYSVRISSGANCRGLQRIASAERQPSGSWKRFRSTNVSRLRPCGANGLADQSEPTWMMNHEPQRQRFCLAPFIEMRPQARVWLPKAPSAGRLMCSVLADCEQQLPLAPGLCFKNASAIKSACVSEAAATFAHSSGFSTC